MGWLRSCCCRIHRAVVVFEPWGILVAMLALSMAVIQFWIDYEDRVAERTVRAWQLVTTPAPGNSGKAAALEYLNKEDGFLCSGWIDAGCLLLLKPRTPLVGIDLSPGNTGAAGSPQRPLGTYLVDVNLSRAILIHANLTGAILNGANLTGANLTGANLAGTILTGAILTGADLAGVILAGAHLGGADLRGVSGLDCSQLVVANGWRYSHRDMSLACGTGIPLPPQDGRGR